MIDRHTRLLSNLITIARDNEPAGSHRLVSCIVLKNKVIAYGFNQLKTHPFQSQFAKNPDAIFWHSETNAIFNALKVISENDLRKTTLYVARIKSTGPVGDITWGKSIPCEGCMSCLNRYKIKKVIYTLEGINHYGTMIF